MAVLTKPPPNANLSDDIADLLALGDRARFRDYAQLRSGFDRWSDIGLPELRRRAPPDAAEAVRAAIVGEVHEAAALRWVLRGLPALMAVKKIETDIEVNRNARAAGKARRACA
jgi:ribonuclease HI